MSSAPTELKVRDTYDAMAGSYDEFNHAYMYERWTGRLLERAVANGLTGDRLLDVGCGTGLSFLPMLERGWRVSGCDISPEMLERARAKAGPGVELAVADMRALPLFGEFDLIWAVNDAMNYLLSTEEFQSTLRGMRRNLAPQGRIVFDINTLTAYRNFWSGEHVIENGEKRFLWHGGEAEEVTSGAFYEARFGGDGEPHVHHQRHFPPDEVLPAIAAAGLRCLDLAATVDGELDDELDEDLHTKAIYVCAAA
jgi:SAM-dependent methyltransferase